MDNEPLHSVNNLFLTIKHVSATHVTPYNIEADVLGKELKLIESRIHGNFQTRK